MFTLEQCKCTLFWHKFSFLGWVEILQTEDPYPPTYLYLWSGIMIPTAPWRLH